jgi:cytochrome c
MKRILVIACFSFLIVSCGSQSSEDKQPPTEDKTATSASKDNPDYTKGLNLIANSDCLTCHKVTEQLIGPAYEVVAAKYPATDEVIDTLAQTIIKGSVGKWGQVPMTSHPGLSNEDAKAMVKYIMTLKK